MGRRVRRPRAASASRVSDPGWSFSVASLASVLTIVSLLGSAPSVQAVDHNQPPRQQAASPQPTLTEMAGTLEGIDVSHWQGTIDWPRVAAAGKKFVIMKATEGTGFVDWMYATNHAGARAAGIPTTAYHFANPGATPGDAVAEADHFVNIASLTDGDLVPALDLEQSGGLGTTALRNWVASWLAHVTARVGVKPMIYVSPAFWVKYLGDTRYFADAGYKILWIAHWGVSNPTVPAQNWGGRGWTFWQYSDCGSVPGISGCVDLDRYNGTNLEAVTYHPGFRLSASPASFALKQGRSWLSTIGIARTNFTHPVELSVSGLPAGASATFSASPTTGSSSILTITTSNTGNVTPTGTYPVTVSGEGGGLSRATVVNVTVVDGIAPTIAAPVAWLMTGQLGATTTRVAIGWSGSDPGGIVSYHLDRQVNGGAWARVSLPTATSVSVIHTLTLGAVYRYRLAATDRLGNVTAWTYGRPFKALLVHQTNPAVSYGGTWHTAFSSAVSGGSLRYSTAAGAWASYAVYGTGAAWVAYRGPGRGYARVYLDGVYQGAISLYASTNTAKPIVFAARWGTMSGHALKVVVVGTSTRPRVDVDAFLRLYRY
jgi:GH25 family lysozyme M1 (1,4-beta-N-acetylmuramidase)